MDNLNNFELKVLERVALKFPTIKSHIPHLKVAKREFTGVGVYVNFYYSEPSDDLKSLDMTNASLATNDEIKIEGLKYELAWEVDITDGRIKFIEFATNGNEAWDGCVDNFSIVERG